jgi:hypothetical protein
MDGYPKGVQAYVGGKELLTSETKEEFLRALKMFFISKGEQVTRPEDGWPWPWNDSRTTDFAYAFDDGKAWMSSFGHSWLPASEPEPEEWPDGDKVAFPDMTALKNVTMGPRSGVMLFRAP